MHAAPYFLGNLPLNMNKPKLAQERIRGHVKKDCSCPGHH